MLTQLRNSVLDILATKRSERSIAMGFAVGTFLAVLPLLGLSIFVGFIVAVLYKPINKFALFGAMALWNPLVLIPIYWLSFVIGDFFLGPLPIVEYEVALPDRVFHFSRRFLLGNVLLASFLSITSYYLMRRAVVIYRERFGETRRTTNEEG